MNPYAGSEKEEPITKQEKLTKSRFVFGITASYLCLSIGTLGLMFSFFGKDGLTFMLFTLIIFGLFMILLTFIMEQKVIEIGGWDK